MQSFLSETLAQLSSNTANKVIPVVCAADDKYAMPVAVMARSILSNLDSSQSLLLFVIDGGIEEHNKQKILKSLEHTQCTIEWLKPSNDLLKNLKLTRYFSVAMYYRLLIPELLPQHFDRAIYLDCDLIVNADLRKLWDIDMGDNYLLAAVDTHFPYMSSGLLNSEKLNIPPDWKYFNSGVLVFNLKKWRAEQIGLKVIHYIDQHPEDIQFPDQDGLNIVLAGQWGELDLRWNQTPSIYDYTSWEDSPFEQETYSNVINDPWIIHFASKFKPWNTYKFKKDHKELFYQYLDMTAWRGWRFSFLKAVYKKIYRIIFNTEER